MYNHNINFKFLSIQIKPEWKYGAQYALNTVQPVMFYDSWTNSEPLSNYEHHTEIYKYINAAKGRYPNDLELFKLCKRRYNKTT